MLMQLILWCLSPRTAQAVRARYLYARKTRKMGMLTTYFYLFWLAVCYTVFRLESTAWQQVKLRYRPWFAHLLDREYRFGDSLRFLLQGVWLLVVNPYRRPMQFRFRWRRKSPKVLFINEPKTTIESKGAHFSKATLILGGLVVMVFGVLVVTQPFSLKAQFFFVLLLWMAAMIARRIPGRFSILFLIVLSLIVSARYIWWRYTASLNWNDHKDMFFGLVLLAAETYSWIVLVLGYVQTAWPLDRPIAPLPKDTTQWPTVDVMIPTYNEGLEVVRPTVYAALGLDWPADKLRIHLLDDGRRELFKQFAQEVGVNYIIRPDGRHAKAGNLNHAMQHTDGDLVVVFDCDHIPVRSFLQLTVGWFLQNKKLALVQTPHHFFSPDPFERNLHHHGEKPNENTLFYGLIQEGNDLWNAAFFCGSCAVLRRDALEDIGGFAVETVTEDAHTALRLHRKGYDSAYIRIPLAAGLATESLSAHIGQRIRWARGMVQIFRTDNPLWGGGLNLFQRLCYLNGMIHFLAGIPRIIYLTAPLAFLIFHAYIIYAPALVILLYVLPHLIHAGMTNSVMQGSYRRTFWGEVYETVLSWYIALPTTLALLAPKKGLFNVTEKGGLIEKEYFDWRIASPYLLLAGLNLAGLFVGVWRFMVGPQNEQLTVLVTMLWVFYNLVILGGAVAVASETRQVRRNHRIGAHLPLTLSTKEGRSYAARMEDYSMTGLGLWLEEVGTLTKGQEISILMSRGAHHFSLPAKVVRVEGPLIGLEFEPLSIEQEIDFVQSTFARSDAWLSVRDGFPADKPIISFFDVLRYSLGGYRKLLLILPFPFGPLARGIDRLFSWFGSFLPRTQLVVRHEN